MGHGLDVGSSGRENYFTPQSFKDSLCRAARWSDGWVWVYTQKPNWWTGENLPKEYVASLKNCISELEGR